MSNITKHHKNRIVWMMDDNFFSVLKIWPGWIDEFVGEMRRQNIKCRFKIFARADQIEEEVLLKLKSVGLAGVVVGVESMIERQLKLYGKHVEPETNRQALLTIQRTGLWLDMGFILLDPYTTLEELEQNLCFLRESPFVEISEPGHEFISSLGPLIVLEDTPIHRYLSLGPLIVLEDTPIHRYLSSQNILSGTDVGYNYQSEEITFFHKALKQWNKEIAGEYFDFNKRQLFTYYNEHGRMKDSYLIKYKECLRIDIEFMWSVLKYVRMGKMNEGEVKVMIEEYKQKFVSVINEDEIENIINRILPIFQEYCLEKISEDTNLLEVGLNSIQAVRGLIRLEKTLGIRFDDEELDISALCTVKNLAKFIQDKIRRANGQN